LLGTEKPDLEKEIARGDGQMAKTQGTIDRYFEAFEAGTLKAELCNEKVRDLRTRMEEMEGEKRSLEARREQLELPAIDKEMLSSLLDNFEKVMAEGHNPKNKHLLHQLVKKVLIYSRQTIEIWYMLPNAFPIYMKISDKVHHLRRVGMPLRRDCRTPPDQPLDGEEGSSLGKNPSCAAPSAIPQLRH